MHFFRVRRLSSALSLNGKVTHEDEGLVSSPVDGTKSYVAATVYYINDGEI